MRDVFICIYVIFSIIFSCNCSTSQNQSFILKGPYLGQEPPGMEPKIFAPGIISTEHYERSLVFSPDLKEAYYQSRGRKYTTILLQMSESEKGWETPHVASFSGYPEYRDDCPFFSYDGKWLFFASRRPLPGTDSIQKEHDIWMINQDPKGLYQPEHLGSVLNSTGEDHYPTVSRMNNIYFNSNRDNNYDIYVSKYSVTGCSEPVRLTDPINTNGFEGHPYIAADESYLIFSSDRPGQLGDADLYISFRNSDKTWGEPVNMGDQINTPFHEAAPYISPDGKYFFFCSFRLNPDSYQGKKFNVEKFKKMLNGPGNGSGDIYWVNTKIIEQLMPN